MRHAGNAGNAAILYDIAQATHGHGTAQRDLFSYRMATPVAPSPTMPSEPAPNAETPLLRKTRFLCNAYLYPLPIKTAFLYVNIVY